MFCHRHVFVWSVVMIMALGRLRQGQCEGLTYASLASDSEMSTWHQSMPPSMYLNITLEDNDLQLSLQQNEDAHSDIPMFELVPGVDGKGRLQRVPVKHDKSFALYHDVQHTAVFRVSIHANKDRPHLSIVGIIHSTSNLYDVRSTPLQFVPTIRTRRGGDDTQKDSFFSHNVLFEVNVLNTTTRDSYGAIPNRAARPSPHLRHKRGAIQDINVDVLAVIDYEIYRRWYNSSTTSSPTARQDALGKIYKYYAFVFSGMNMLYKTIDSLPYKINVRLTTMIVSVTAESSGWTELNKKRARSHNIFHVDAKTILQSFTDWANTNKVPPNDHSMLFTGYEVTQNSGADYSITGLANIGTLCTGSQQTSIVEDRGGFQCIGTAAHELGHSLSAQHDGTNNYCKAEDRYIMSPATYIETVSNKFNPWRFSSCSVAYFDNFITKSTKTTRQCLTEALTVSPSIPDVSSLMLGQVYDAHQQCQQVYGQLSFFCQLTGNNTVVDVCRNLFCFDPTTGQCALHRSAPGTSCGNKKWCINGQCIYDAKAPAKDDNCIFGDYRGVVFMNKPCNTFISEFPGRCYESQNRNLCCQSCAKFRRDVHSCEYRDRSLGCKKQSCAFQPRNYKEQCCYTCGSSSNANSFFILCIAIVTAVTVLSL